MLIGFIKAYMAVHVKHFVKNMTKTLKNGRNNGGAVRFRQRRTADFPYILYSAR